MATPESFVWVQVYYEDKKEPKGNAFKIKPVPEDVGDLTEAAITKLKLDAPVDEIYAYPPGTKPPFAKANSLRPGKPLQEVIEEFKNTTPPTSDEHPLIVVAPKKTTPDSGITLNLPFAEKPMEDAIRALAHYREIGKKTREYASTNHQYNLQDHLEDLNKNLHSVAFAMLDGPSGIGKTQYSFSLDETTTRYFVLSGASKSQAIYKNFEEISRVFRNAVSRDKDIQTSAGGEISYADLKGGTFLRKSHTAGLLKAVFALEHYPESLVEIHGTTIEPLAYNDFWKSCKGYGNYVVVLDEVGSLTTDMEFLRFTRNLLRSLGVRVLLMGTHASASTLVDQATHSRGSGEWETWCRVLTDCPPFLGDTEVQVGPFQMKTEYLGRPLLVELVQRHRQACGDGISQAQVLDSLLKKVVADLRERKPKAWNEGLLGQFCMFHPGYYCGEEPASKKPRVDCLDPVVSNLIVSHFPYLVHQFRGGGLTHPDRKTPWVDLGTHNVGLVNKKKQVWNPMCEYRAEELFLFFVLSRWDSCFSDSCFSEVTGNERTSAYSAYQRLRDAPKGVATIPDMSNPKAKKASGDALEGVASVAFIVASHIEGVGGCSLERFVSAFISELFPVSETLRYAAKDYRGDTGTVLKLFKDLVDENVPYLGPTNVEIPKEWYSLDGVKFGNVTRPADKASIDILVTRCGKETAFMACECKNFNVNGAVLKDVMDRVKPEWKVHFLVCQSHTKFQDASVPKAMAHCEDRHLVEATVKEGVISFKILYKPPQASTQASKLSLIVFYENTGIQQ